MQRVPGGALQGGRLQRRLRRLRGRQVLGPWPGGLRGLRRGSVLPGRHARLRGLPPGLLLGADGGDVRGGLPTVRYGEVEQSERRGLGGGVCGLRGWLDHALGWSAYAGALHSATCWAELFLHFWHGLCGGWGHGP